MSRKPLFSRFMAGIVSVISLVFFTLTLTTANAAPLATTVVTPATPNGWIWALESGTNGSVSFVSGPATPPAGTGSARLQTGNGATGVVLSRNGIYPGLRFDDITTLTYDLYKSAGSSSTNDVIFQLNVDYNLLDATTSWQGRLVYEPYYSSSLPAGSWNSIDPLAGSAGWWATGAPGNGVCPISDPCTWAEVLTTFPNAGIQTGGLAAIHFKAGSGWTTPFDGNVDNLHIVADGGIDDTYDFDAGVAPGPTCTTTCYVSTLGNNSNGGASADDPLRTIQEGINRVDVGGTVVVAEGVYVESLTLNKWLTLDGAGSGTDFASDTLIIAPTAPQDVLTINSGGSSATDRTVIQDVHFTRAVAPTATDTGDGVFINAGSFITFDTVASTLHPSNGFNFGAGPVNDLEILNSDLSGNFGNGWRSASGTVLDGFLLENSNVGNNRGFGLITGGGTNSNLHDNITLRDSTFTANYHTSPGLGSGDVSFFLYNGNLTVENVTINGVASPTVGPHIGFQLRGANTPAPSGTVVIDGLTITGNYIRPGGTPGNSFRLTNYGAGSSISINDLDVDSGNNSVGVLLSGLSDTTDLGNAVLDGLAVIAMEGSAQNPTAGSNATATDTTINGVSAGTATLPQLFAIEDVIYHRIDVGTPVNTNQAIGLARVRANNVYVTSNSFLAPVTTTPSIQRGVDAASVGDTVNVSAGAFNENITIPKSLTLDGVGAGTNAATHTIIEGNVPTVWGGNGITVNSLVTDVTIRDLRVQNFLNGNGIHATSRNDRFTADSVHTVNNRTAIAGIVAGGGIFMAGPVDTVLITNSESRDNNSRGIVIWDGYKSNITITNNIVTGNRCCGIELQDGTASGVTMTGNTVSDNADSGMSAIGLTDGDGPNLIAGNTLTNNGRFGIEIKMPDGNGADAGDGSIVVENNNVSRSFVPADARDLAGISVYRRGFVMGNGYIDIPTGVIVRNNTVSGYQQTTQSDGFGIVVEGVDHEVSGNTLNNNDVGVQAQGGHLPYNPNAGGDGDQSNLNDQFFGRGNAPYGCAAVSGNMFSGNSMDSRSVGNGGVGIRATNLNTTETFCTIQAAIDDADTVAGHTIEVAAGTWEEQVEVDKAITLEGQGEGTTTIVAPVDMPDFFVSDGPNNNYPIIYVHDVNATIRDLTVDGMGRGNLNYRFMGVAFEQAGGTLESVTITGMTETPFNGNQHGNGIWGRANNGTDRTLTVTDVTITDFQKNGTVFSGVDLTVTMDDSIVEGSGPLGTGMPAQNGIQLSGGAAGSFDNNTISDINYTPGSFASIGILISGSSGSTQVTNNTVIDTKNAIDFREAEGDAIGNTISNTAGNMGATTVAWGITVFNQVAAPPFAEEGNKTPPAALFADGSEAEDATPDAAALLNRDYTIENNTLNGAGFGYGIGLYALASETTTILVNENAVDNWEGGIDHYTTTSLDTEITANTITGSDYGIYFSDGTSTITNNTIDNNGVGVWVDGGTVSPTIYENAITNSSTFGVNNTSAGIAVVNASANWWGSNTPAGVAAEVSAGVDYTPWFNVGTDTDGGTAGWQGDFSWFNADDTSPQTGAVGRINEAITLVTTGGTVNLAAGTYNETATVPKSLRLQGAGATTILDGNSPANQTGNGITLNSGVTDVTIQDLRVQDYGGTGLGSGIFGTLGNNNLIVQRTELYNNNLSNTGNGGGLYMNGPVNTVLVDDNDVVNNRSRGIVIWNGFKQNITITNNYVANNICCGIELQDGTASGVTVTGNIVENNGDSGMAFVGLQGGAGANLIANNTVTNNGRFGIEIKLPNGNGATSGDGSIVVEFNTVSRTVAIPGGEQRDLAGISVYRRGYVVSEGNVDIPVGVVVRNNTVSGYAQPTTSDGFGIVVEGTNHNVLNNTLNNNDVGVQVQGGHLPYTPNTNIDGDQSNLNDQFFGRGNAPYGCAAVTGNIFSGNTTDTRSVGNGGAGIRATNMNTSESFCTIQAAIDDADTVAGHTVEVAAGTWEEQVEVHKAITLSGQGEGVTTILSPVTLTKFFVTSVNNYPMIYVHDVNATIEDMTVNGAGRGNNNNRFIGIGFRNAGGAVNRVTITDIRHTPISGIQGGVGIYALADNGTPRTLAVDDATITGFQKNGTAFNGVNLTATIANSTITGAGSVNFIAQNGVQWGFGATGSANNNTISDIGYTPTSDNGSGYLLYQATGTIQITNSDLEDLEVAAYAYDSALTFTGNTVTQTAAGLPGMPNWYGVFIASDVPAPLTPNATVQPFGEGASGGSANAVMNRSHLINANTMTSEGRGGTAIGTDVDAMEVTSINILTNTIEAWNVGIEFDGDGLLASNVDDNRIADNAVGIVIRTGVLNITNNAITEGAVGIRYFDSDGVEPEVHGNDIDYNTVWGIEHATFPGNTTIVDATSNYWGDPSGPLDTHLPFSGACPSLGEYNPTSTGNPVTECVRWAPPLVVTMANFEAVARPNDILVLWETASETDNLGFNLYRATSPDGTPEQLNEELIPSQSPGNGQGAMYEWADADVTEGVTYYYWLEAVDIYGAGSPFFGPVSATYGVPTAVTVSELNAQPATLPALLAAGLLIFGAIGVVVVRRRKA